MTPDFRFNPVRHRELNPAENAARMSLARRNGTVPNQPTKIKALTKRFMAFRAAQREAHEPVDSFCRRGEDAPRFAYFD